MTKEELIEFLSNSLTVQIEHRKGRAYWDTTEIEITLLLEGEPISTSTTTVYED